MTKNDFLAELSRFADLDSDPAITSSGNTFTAKFRQNGEPVSLQLDKDSGPVVEIRGQQKRKYGSYRGLLASPAFGNLKRLAEFQKSQIRVEARYIENVSTHLPVVGSLREGEQLAIDDADLFARVDAWLTSVPSDGSRVRALVVDGPAGIGKTHLIRRLVHSRASSYGPASAPPILHVQSRGRRLTTLNDVLAGTLQALRATVTFDQVPILVRHGLLQVAIDGFDELADPSGYDTAWGSLRDFVEELKGMGTILLAGRDTFINVSSIKRAITLLDSPNTCAVHLRPLRPTEAKHWLKALKWPEKRIQALQEAGLLEDESYALRPFFIRKISEFGKSNKDFEKFVEFPLRALVSAMLHREAELAGKRIQLPVEEISRLLQEILKEVARDMADAESESVDENALDLVAEMVLSKVISEDQLAIFRHRIKSLTLLEGDAQSSSRRFAHTELQDYFLGLAYISIVSAGEVSKSLRRGLVSGDFLETFHDIALASPSSQVREFYVRASAVLAGRTVEDRGSRNVAALILAALPGGFTDISPIRAIQNQTMAEAVLRGDIPPFDVNSTDISQLDARGANLNALSLKDSNITTLIVDSTTRLPDNFPTPLALRVDDEGRSLLTSPEQIREWIGRHSPVSKTKHGKADNEHIVLFERLCRAVVRQFWIRSTGDDPAARLLTRPQWPSIKEILQRHDLLRIRENVRVGGPRSDFYRIERARDFLEGAPTDPQISCVRKEIAAAGEE